MALLEEVKAALFEVIDPELGVNIMDLGLIYHVELDEAAHVFIEMTLTTPGCPMSDSITSGVKARIGHVDGVEKVTIDLVWEPMWTPLKMSDRCKEQLGVM